MDPMMGGMAWHACDQRVTDGREESACRRRRHGWKGVMHAIRFGGLSVFVSLDEMECLLSPFLSLSHFRLSLSTSIPAPPLPRGKRRGQREEGRERGRERERGPWKQEGERGAMLLVPASNGATTRECVRLGCCDSGGGACETVPVLGLASVYASSCGSL